jgi:hypothetical protein
MSKRKRNRHPVVEHLDAMDWDPVHGEAFEILLDHVGEEIEAAEMMIATGLEALYVAYGDDKEHLKETLSEWLTCIAGQMAAAREGGRHPLIAVDEESRGIEH